MAIPLLPMSVLEERIAHSLRESLRKGELQASEHWGKPLELDDASAHTPESLRLGFRVLKTAGYVPAEVLTMRQLAALRRAIAADPHAPEAEALRQRASELQQQLALRLEQLRRNGSL